MRTLISEMVRGVNMSNSEIEEPLDELAKYIETI